MFYLNKRPILRSGSKIVFNSFIAPLFGRFFNQAGSTSANLRTQAENVTKTQ